MLIGYVSDERYVAIADCLLLFESGSVTLEARSAANGAVYADLAPGRYEVSLSARGFGPKRVRVEIGERAHHFRLLARGLLGYVCINHRLYRRGTPGFFYLAQPDLVGQPALDYAHHLGQAIERIQVQECNIAQVVGW